MHVHFHFLLLVSSWILLFLYSVDANTTITCLDKEREALLKFKQSISEDDCGLLTSWRSEKNKDCCQWSGVQCSNHTGHVVRLDLHGYGDNSFCIKGKFDVRSLAELKELNYLDLSINDFSGSTIPEAIGSLNNLRYLNLSYNAFEGKIPPQLGNISRLESLDLNLNTLYAEELSWLLRLRSLKFLNLDTIDLSKATDWVEVVSNLPSLRVLHMNLCLLSPPTLISPVSLVNSSTSLAVLDLGVNNLNSSIYPWLHNFTRKNAHLVNIDLSSNQLIGPMPDDIFDHLSELSNLDLSSNQLLGPILSPTFDNLCSLQTLDLSHNAFAEELPRFVQTIPQCVQESLLVLDLSGNQLWGSVPDISVVFPSLTELKLDQNQLNGSLPLKFKERHSSLLTLSLSGNQVTGILPDLSVFQFLEFLDLSNNNLYGSISPGIGALFQLNYVDISYNFLNGTISNDHFLNLTRLFHLDLSYNPLVFDLSANWVPPFLIDTLRLRSCILGPQFPKWIQNQISFTELDISDTGISETIPDWFWNVSSLAISLNVSYNNITGQLPNLSITFTSTPSIDLSYNFLEGTIPMFLRNASSLILRGNMFSTGLTSFVCREGGSPLLNLDLSYNSLTEYIPDCWMNLDLLSVLVLANNHLSGNLPNSIGSLTSLQTLNLRDNNITGELPVSLKNCSSLQIVDLGFNSLSGRIVNLMGSSFQNLMILSLRSNSFRGSIPSTLCELSTLQVLDLSLNTLSGPIPRCIKNLTGMSLNSTSASSVSHDFAAINSNDAFVTYYADHASVLWNGYEQTFSNTLGLMKIIDLSSNHLAGGIPSGATFLTGLVALNLSRNNLTGSIPLNIGMMATLQFFDLSQNKLSGPIPGSLSILNFLSSLNLSYNEFSGRIPTSTQLQSFDASTFIGNPDLCGLPLKKCIGDESSPAETEDDGDDGHTFPGLYISIALGFIIGFWGFIGTVVIKTSWRKAYFRLLGDAIDKMYVKVAVKWANLRRQPLI